MSSERLRIALTKGRLQDKSVEIFEAMGLDCSPIKDPGRRLVHSIPNYPLDAVLATVLLCMLPLMAVVVVYISRLTSRLSV